MSATSEQRRAAAVRRIKALGPQPRPVFRSGVDIDAVHYRMHPPKVAAPDDRPLGQAAGAAPRSERLGRDSILIDLDERNVPMAHGRITAGAPLLAQVEVAA